MVLHKVPCQTIHVGNNAISIFEESHDAFSFAKTIADLKAIQGDNRPFFVCDVDRVSMLLDEWFNLLPRVQPLYAVNCNANPVLLQLLAKQPSVGFHCITRENLDAVADIVSPDRILYSNPCWSRGNLRHAIQSGVQTLAFDSVQSLDRILGACPDAELILNVCIDPTVEDSNAALGCTLEEAPELLGMAATLGANCVGIGFNIGSGCRQSSLYTAAIEVSANLFSIGKTFGLNMKQLNIGGGFANSYFHNQEQFATFADIAMQINEALDYFFPESSYPNLKITAKPGRFFAGPIFSLATNIIGKDCVDASQVTNDDFDCGNDAFIYRINEGYYGSFGCQIVANCEPQCTPLFENENIGLEHYYGSVWGPTSDEYDVVQKLCRFRQMELGDWLFWSNIGAYSMHNRCSLDDSDDKNDGPFVYYFSTLSNWQKLNCVYPVVSDKVFLHSDPVNVDAGELLRSPSPMSVGSVEDDSDARSVTSETTSIFEEETDELWRLMWHLYECVGK